MMNATVNGKAAFCLIGLAALAVAPAAAVQVVPAGETFFTNIAADATLEGEWLIGGTFCKLGPGKLTIPAKKVWFVEGRLDVLEGSADIVTTGEDATFDATAVANKAAFWLKAGVNYVRDDDENLLQWRDARDSATTALPSMPFGKAMTNLADNAAFPETGVDGTLPYVYFGGYASGRWLFWRTADDSDRYWLDTVHTFTVYNPLDSHGHFLSTENYLSGAHAQYFAVSTGNAGKTLFCDTYKTTPDTYAQVRLGRVFLDGRRVQPTRAIDLNTLQLIETRAGAILPGADSCFNFNNYQKKSPQGAQFAGNRVGGGRLHEILVYTNRLDETERLLLEGQLLRAWGLATMRAPKTANVAHGAQLAAAAGYLDGTDCRYECDLDAAALTTVPDNVYGPYVARIRIKSGETVTNRSQYVCTADAGLALNVDDRCAVSATDGTPGMLEKRGAGSLALDEIPEGAKLKVTEGRVGLGSYTASPWLATTNANLIADGSFEGLARSDGLAVGETRGAWEAETASNSIRIYNNGDWKDASGKTRILNTTAGTKYLHIKGFTGGYASIKQTFTVPTTGRHELTFLTATRRDGNYETALSVFIDDSRVACVPATSKTFWQAWRAVTPTLAAGEHVFRFKIEYAADRTVGIDDVRLVWRDDAHTVPFENANFETLDFGTTAPALSTLSLFRFTADKARGWTASDTSLANVVRYANDDLSVAGDTAAPAPYESGTGDSFSLLLTPGSTMTTSCTVTESGRYVFSAHCAKVGESGNELPDQSAIPLTVTVNGASETINVNTFAFDAYTGQLSYDLTAGETVTLTLSEANVEGYRVVVDDIALTRPSAQNLLVNPSFEIGSSAGFRTNGWEVFIAASRSMTYPRTSYNDQYFGSSTIDGETRLRLHSWDGWARQTVTLPEAGLYRFAFWARARIYDTDEKSGYWPGALDVFAVVDGVTNLAARAAISAVDHKFQRYAYTFRVPRAGATCTVGVHGTRDVLDDKGTDDYSAFVDACSLERITDVEPVSLPETASFEVVSGAKLALDYPGTNAVNRVRLGGRGRKGLVSGTDPALSDFLEGPGSLTSHSKGLFLMLQ